MGITAGATNRYLAIALIAFGAFVVWLALPVVRDGLVAQSSIQTIAALRRYEHVSDNEIRASLEALGPISEAATGDRLIDQSILSLVLAERLNEDRPERVALLVDATRLAQARLDRAPNDTHAWARLSYGEYLLNGPSELAVTALRRSFETGPVEYYALWSRLRLGVLLWPFLDEAMRAQTLDQARTALRTGGGAYRLAQFYFKMPGEIQVELLRHVQGAQGQDDFAAFLARERERRQGS